ncbi:bacterial proteasome activator family protein [Actinomarinicola tropica]|uniref:bacterial proteasome activator family protein n=1 Tax=Actinomarinicola tropica TaxID=2789776 RepID=UPI002B4BA24C|nr:bacterial proteasome activator family protein [Actinomarinicola tropica]
MSDANPTPDESTVERGELVQPVEAEPEEHREAVDEPAKVMRIGSMMKQLLDEVRSTDLDEASRDRLRDIYDLSVNELGSALSPDLQEELDRLAMPFGDEDVPSGAELRIAKAQLVGWLEGLFHGIQATLFAQQMAARQQIEQMRQSQLMPPQGGPAAEAGHTDRPGTYL